MKTKNNFLRLGFVVLFFVTCVSSVWGQNLATISYKSTKGPVTIPITLTEFKESYKVVKQLAPISAPTARIFWKDYLPYRLGVEEAYNNTEIIKNPAMRNMFADTNLQQTFEQNLYKTLIRKKLKGRIAVLNKQSMKLPQSTMRKLYRKNPEYIFHFILITLPANPSATNIKEARTRAQKIYQDVRSSKKPFYQLIDLYSDDRSGKISMSRSRNAIIPAIYKKIQTMKKGQISSPIQTYNGFYIVRLASKVPFKNADHTSIKAGYFDRERGKIIKNYFKGLKNSKYKVQVNRSLLKTI